MPDGDLRQLAEVEQISIGFTRPDRSTGSTPVWVVQAGEEIFVRSIRGRRGGWYRRLRANPDGEVGDGAHTHLVRARLVQDAGTVEAVTGAYAAKYGDSPSVGPLLTGEAADAHLIPGRTRPATAVQTQGAGRRCTALSQRLQQNQNEQAQGDPSEAPGFGDRISRRCQSAELGHHLPAQARRFIAWLGARRSGQGSTL